MRSSEIVILTAVLTASCKVGPDYARPAAVASSAFKEVDGWKPAQPRDEAGREGWWELFGLADLNSLEEQLDISNQNLKVAEAQYRSARAAVRIAAAGLWPTVTVSAGATHAHNVAASTSTSVAPVPTNRDVTTYSLPASLSWELDVWGRIRRSIEASSDQAQASKADLASLRLSTQAALAQDYLQLRTLDAQVALYQATLQAFETSLAVTRNRYATGVAARSDVLQAETQLEAARAQAVDLGLLRAQTEHAIAVLTGQPPANLSLAPLPLTGEPPAVPLCLPSELLERRPDVAAAERRMAAANAQIGVATAAWFPRVTLSGSVGFLTSTLTNWLSWPSFFWSVGPALAETVFEGGLRSAQVTQTRANYEAAVASYRQTVLNAFQEVEDNLAALRLLEEEARVQSKTVEAARELVAITTNQYKAGVQSYLEVAVAMTTALNAERVAIDIAGRRMIATVLLVKALGGGWKADELEGKAAAPAGETKAGSGETNSKDAQAPAQ